ncbi:MAGE family protein [Trichinella nativa]|uniref:MAGE family protein n=1 Tax=Trichinella nativa TaxID=6335 RepID=A0A1Y3ETN6_9BILA|nr:MAGE family protein [Trichinella nativa]
MSDSEIDYDAPGPSHIIPKKKRILKSPSKPLTAKDMALQIATSIVATMNKTQVYRKNEIVKNFLSTSQFKLKEVWRELVPILSQDYNIEVIEDDNKRTGRFYLKSKTVTEPGEILSDQLAERCGILYTVLCAIFIYNPVELKIKEKALWNFLENLFENENCLDDEFSRKEIRELINNVFTAEGNLSLLTLGWLQHRRVVEDNKKNEYLWGVRARKVINKKEMLTNICEVLRKPVSDSILRAYIYENDEQ